MPGQTRRSTALRLLRGAAPALAAIALLALVLWDRDGEGAYTQQRDSLFQSLCVPQPASQHAWEGSLAAPYERQKGGR